MSRICVDAMHLPVPTRLLARKKLAAASSKFLPNGNSIGYDPSCFLSSEIHPDKTGSRSGGRKISEWLKKKGKKPNTRRRGTERVREEEVCENEKLEAESIPL